MGERRPRYDLPRAAPPPLREVQAFVNTVDLSHARDWLDDWLASEGIATPSQVEVGRARTVREAIREQLYANNGQAAAVTGVPALNTAANAAMLTLDFTRPGLVALAPGVDGLLGRIVIRCFEAIADGSWRRLKCCRNHDCRWAFYDDSKNRSATWCSMQICGNRSKTRTYRAGRQGLPH